MGARTLKAGANTVKLHLLSCLRCFVCGEMELSINMGRPLSSGAYSTTEPDGKPDAAPSDASVDKVPTLHKTRTDVECLHKLGSIGSY